MGDDAEVDLDRNGGEIMEAFFAIPSTSREPILILEHSGEDEIDDDDDDDDDDIVDKDNGEIFAILVKSDVVRLPGGHMLTLMLALIVERVALTESESAFAEWSYDAVDSNVGRTPINEPPL